MRDRKVIQLIVLNKTNFRTNTFIQEGQHFSKITKSK